MNMSSICIYSPLYTQLATFFFQKEVSSLASKGQPKNTTINKDKFCQGMPLEKRKHCADGFVLNIDEL